MNHSSYKVSFDRYVSVGDVAHVGNHTPTVAAVYKDFDGNFALPVGYDLVSHLKIFQLISMVFVSTLYSELERVQFILFISLIKSYIQNWLLSLLISLQILYSY